MAAPSNVIGKPSISWVVSCTPGHSRASVVCSNSSLNLTADKVKWSLCVSRFQPAGVASCLPQSPWPMIKIYILTLSPLVVADIFHVPCSSSELQTLGRAGQGGERHWGRHSQLWYGRWRRLVHAELDRNYNWTQ
jgi:hypothetical protein